MKNNIITTLKNLIRPRTINNNKKHQAYILNILLTAVIILMIIVSSINLFNLIFSNLGNYKNNLLLLIISSAVLFLFLLLRIISRRGHSLLASYVLISILFIMATYMGCKWGMDLPAEILFYVLAIVVSGILIGSRIAFLDTFLVTIVFITIYHLRTSNIIRIDRSWINEPWGYCDIAITTLILLIIAIVLWLFNRELKKSEEELKNERDLLEIRVAEKTQALKVSQAKEIAQVYRFAEFGKLSSGLFHDLVNPLTALMLNINKVKIDSENNPYFKIIDTEINQAIKASNRMRDFITAVRKQIDFQDQKNIFSINKEIEDAVDILNYKTRQKQLEIILNADENVTIIGNSIQFNQVITNLLSNAIDAYRDRQTNKAIIIELVKTTNNIRIRIIDYGQGINEQTISKIFDPFFTTKNNSNGLGLGLSLIKKIIEESFSGNITVSSKINHGTIFTVELPLS